MQINRLWLQDLYYRSLNEHLFETLSRARPIIANAIVRANYGSRPWTEYPIPQTRDGRPLIFIHIPKCGGTSVANALGYSQIRHLPASAFYLSDKGKFDSSRLFTVIRDPVDRLGSVLMHIQRERQDIDDPGVREENLSQHVSNVLVDRAARRKFFLSTKAGRAGFSVHQYDYLTLNNRLLVKNIFLLNRIDVLEEWLSDQVGHPIRIAHKNASGRKRTHQPDKNLLDLARREIPGDFALYDMVSASGGYVLEDSPAIADVERVMRDASIR